MANTKMMKVMEYLINEQEDKAREMLHQIFIEKARAIHEEMTAEEDMDETMLYSDQGADMADEIQSHKDEIDTEATYAPMEDEDMDMDDAVEDLGGDMDDEDMDDDMDVEDADEVEDADDVEVDVDVDSDEHEDGDHDMEQDSQLHDLEQAIAELKAEFEAMKSGEGEHMDAETDDEDKMAESWETEDEGDLDESVKDVGSYQGIAKWKHTNGNTVTMEDGEWQAHDKKGRVYATGTYEDEDDGTVFYTDSKTADATGVDEISAGMPVSDYAQAAEEILGSLYSSYTKHKGMMENVDLETVQAAKGGEVGSGKFARAETNTRSPVPTTQKDTMGARPVVTGKGSKASGYDRQAAPSSQELSGTANRRKKSTDGMSAVSKEGSAKAMLNKDRSEGFGAPGTRSPISGK